MWIKKICWTFSLLALMACRAGAADHPVHEGPKTQVLEHQRAIGSRGCLFTDRFPDRCGSADSRFHAKSKNHGLNMPKPWPRAVSWS